MVHRVRVGVDVAALDEGALAETVAVVGHADAVRGAGGHRLLAERGAGAAARGLHLLDDEGHRARVLVDKVVHQRVLRAEHAEVVLRAVRERYVSLLGWDRSTLPAARCRQ